MFNLEIMLAQKNARAGSSLPAPTTNDIWRNEFASQDCGIIRESLKSGAGVDLSFQHAEFLRLS